MTDTDYLPDNTRVYAIGDIHGGINLLKKLVGVIEANELILPQKEKLYLIFLGDYIDRGMASKQVIDFLLNKLPPQFEAVFIKGNHEDMMLEAIDCDDKNAVQRFDFWFYNGGQNTILSYGVPSSNHHDIMMAQLEENLTEQHRNFYRNLLTRFEIGNYFFCHAGIRPDVQLSHQKDNELMWIRRVFLESEKQFEKIIVHGHTPEKPHHYGNRIGIDYGSVMSGKLTAVRLEQDGSHEFLTVNHDEDWSN